MAKIRPLDEKIDQLSATTVLEAADLARALEEKWGVSAAAAVAVTAAVAEQASDTVAADREFDVVLTATSTRKKLNVIKAVQAITGLDLAHARHLVDDAPSIVKGALTQEAARDAKQQLENSGGVVEIIEERRNLTDTEWRESLMLGVREYAARTLGRPTDHLIDLRRLMGGIGDGVGI